MKVVFAGDTHGEWSKLQQIIAKHPGDPIFHVGDMGFGFPEYRKSAGLLVPTGKLSHPPELPANFRFIRGNHDRPEDCRNHQNYLGEFGVHEPTGIFFVSGAWSIDHAQRTTGVDWWRDEELSYGQLQEAIDSYYRIRPEVVMTHDCPSSVYEYLKSRRSGHHKTRTSEALEQMLRIHRPRLWVFGHHHIVWRKQTEKTKFICVASNASVTEEI